MKLGEESFVALVQSESDIAAVQCSEEEWTVGCGGGKGDLLWLLCNVNQYVLKSRKERCTVHNMCLIQLD